MYSVICCEFTCYLKISSDILLPLAIHKTIMVQAPNIATVMAEGKPVLWYVHNWHTRNLANASLQIFVTCCHDVTFMLQARKRTHYHHKQMKASKLLPAALRAAQTCRYFVYSEADFEVFRPAGATRCTDGGEIWHGGPLLHAKFHPHRCNDKGVGTQNLNFYSDLTEMWNINAPQGRIPCAIFTKVAQFVPHFRTR